MSVQLGYIIPKEDQAPLPKYYCSINDLPNKIGGLPIWLDPRNPAGRVECGNCSKQMPLLLQLYAPQDYPSNAFHRVVYVFCCKSGSCVISNKGIKVLRLQLERENEIYNEEGDLLIEFQVQDGALSNSKGVNYCYICGKSAPSRCGKCHVNKYCSREHQELDWTHGHHKHLCGTGNEARNEIKSWLSTFNFPELEMEEEEEPEKKVEQVEPEIMEKLNVKEEGDNVLEDEDETEAEVDRTFLKFQKRISLSPDQVLRYGRQPEGDNPLWASDIGRNNTIPNCPKCSSPRTFEFQLTPQLLSHLELNNKDPNSIDWGTVIVYTCKSDCDAANGQYAEEYAFVQEFASAGLGDSHRKILAERAEKEETQD
ncbi:Programmed cell death protein 2 [Boothiomyces macroporosus]|uniref:Programmed cell death protein 2 n=1 Tax=Boothiomyces macroporosus TaxID=261099 RepID=A0AAD5UBQ6_9FUNG|nr:Programmed cell death protein 2 [Boothiomyces macroporosus]